MFFSTLAVGQSTMTLNIKETIALKADHIVAVDNFETIYYTVSNILYKKPKNQPSINYSNVQLGIPTTVNAYNPLKINMFFQDFNSVVILDNRLAEIYKIDFNQLQPYRFVTHVSTGYDNTLWVFNQEIQQLELYDYKTNKRRITTVPVQSNVLDLKSDYNYCWMLTENYLYQYTYFGSLISKIENKGYTSMALNNENLVLKSDASLFYKSKKSDAIIPLKTPKLLINQFLLTNETLYIYDSEKLHIYQLKIE
ncbi:hypothetical protein [Formosa sp. Hel1_31_208]|uniref:hypothetical protein n=1 Tax=Formosa sp. Hel1_31_208 TaxID=1798225 RepID=UPI001E2A2AE7|nr:hypothetical protein [Formosa sp. Hel1_31_208]